VIVMEQDTGRGGERADAPGTEADPAQGLERGLEQGVTAFGERAGARTSGCGTGSDQLVVYDWE